MNLRKVLRSGVAAACIVATAAPAGWAAAPAPAEAPARGALEVRTGQGPDFSRIEFHWQGGARVASRRDGQVLTLRFSRDAQPNLAELKVLPPKWLKGVATKHVGGGLEIALTLADDGDAKVGTADGATSPAPTRPDPTPRGGVVRVAAAKAGAGAQFTFPWAAPAGAAVFRRGDALWLVFDAPARIDPSAMPKDGSLYSKVEALRGADYSALRMEVPSSVSVNARSEGANWILTIGGTPAPGTGPSLIEVQRDMEAPTAGLAAVVAGATRTVWVQDPAVGDKLEGHADASRLRRPGHAGHDPGPGAGKLCRRPERAGFGRPRAHRPAEGPGPFAGGGDQCATGRRDGRAAAGGDAGPDRS